MKEIKEIILREKKMEKNPIRMATSDYKSPLGRQVMSFTSAPSDGAVG